MSRRSAGPAQPGRAGAAAGPAKRTDERGREPQDDLRLFRQQGAEELARRSLYGQSTFLERFGLTRSTVLLQLISMGNSTQHPVYIDIFA